MCVHSAAHVYIHVCVSVYVCARAFQACIVRTPACFQYSLLLRGDYPACIWLLSAVDWKLERPGAPWEERSENFLNPVFTLHPSTPVYPTTSQGTILYSCWCLKQQKTLCWVEKCVGCGRTISAYVCMILASEGIVEVPLQLSSAYSNSSTYAICLS